MPSTAVSARSWGALVHAIGTGKRVLVKGLLVDDAGRTLLADSGCQVVMDVDETSEPVDVVVVDIASDPGATLGDALHGTGDRSKVLAIAAEDSVEAVLESFGAEGLVTTDVRPFGDDSRMLLVVHRLPASATEAVLALQARNLSVQRALAAQETLVAALRDELAGASTVASRASDVQEEAHRLRSALEDLQQRYEELWGSRTVRVARRYWRLRDSITAVVNRRRDP